MKTTYYSVSHALTRDEFDVIFTAVNVSIGNLIFDLRNAIEAGNAGSARLLATWIVRAARAAAVLGGWPFPEVDEPETESESSEAVK